MNIETIQQSLQSAGFDGWLFHDFRGSNPIAYEVLGLDPEDFHTRRWYYYVPSTGTPTALISAVETHVLKELPGERKIFQTWQDIHALLRETLPAHGRVAMEYSPQNAIPYVSRVDGGTIDLVRSFGVEVVSSADLAQRFTAQLSEHQIQSQRQAAALLIQAKDTLFAQLKADLKAGRQLDEYGVQQRFIKLIEETGLKVPEDEPPIVAVNGNASNPHYSPSQEIHSPIKRGDIVLFDFWAKQKESDSIYGDLSWATFVGTREEIPARQREVFKTILNARDSAIAYIREQLAAGRPVRGCDVDDVARKVINDAGYGKYFVHRTGHSIGTAVHGNSANVDNFESRDERTLLPFTCNSIEPGIYLPEFGMRSEVDLLVFAQNVEVTGGPIQTEIIPLIEE